MVEQAGMGLCLAKQWHKGGTMLAARMLTAKPPIPAPVSPFFVYAVGLNSNFRTALGTSTGDTTAFTKVGSATYTMIAGGGSFCILLKSDGTLWSSGSNANGKTGQNTTTGDTNGPTQIGSATNWVYISAGTSTAAAINSLGELWTWGSNANYGTGLGTNSGNTLVPTKVGSATTWSKVAMANAFGIATRTNGTLWSFGISAVYQTGQNTTTDVQNPTQIGSATNWSILPASAGELGCGCINTSGELYTWGTNANYVSAQGTNVGSTQVPTKVGTDTNWSGLAFLGQSTAAMLLVKTNGTLWSIGVNDNYRTAQGTNVGDTTTLTQIGIDSNWRKVGGARAYAGGFAIKFDNTAWSWGANYHYAGGLGITDPADTQVPTQIGTAKDWAALMVTGGSTTAFTLALKKV